MTAPSCSLHQVRWPACTVKFFAPRLQELHTRGSREIPYPANRVPDVQLDSPESDRPSKA
jgi:hypothetical protein